MKRWIIFGAVVLLGLLLLPLSNLMLDRTPDPALVARLSDSGLAPELPTLMTSCVDCHTQRIRKPIYMKIPPASWLIADHIEEARSDFDMENELFRENASPSLHILEEMTEVLEEGSMPPFSYKLLHWDAGLSPEEREVLESWIRGARARAEDDEADDDHVHQE